MKNLATQKQSDSANLSFEQAIAIGLKYKILQCTKCRGWTSVKSHAKQKKCPRCGRSFRVPDPHPREQYAPTSLKAGQLVREFQHLEFTGTSPSNCNGYVNPWLKPTGKKFDSSKSDDGANLLVIANAIQARSNVNKRFGIPRTIFTRMLAHESSIPLEVCEVHLRDWILKGHVIQPTPDTIFIEPE